MASAVAGYVLDHYRHKSFNILPTAHKGHHQFCRHLKIVKDWKKSCHKDKSSDRRESDDAEELGSLKMGRWKVLSNERNLTMIHLSVDLRRQTQKCERGEEASWVFQMRQYLWWQYEHQQWWWWWLPTRENVTGRKCIERPPSRVISGLHLVIVIMIEDDDGYYNTTMPVSWQLSWWWPCLLLAPEVEANTCREAEKTEKHLSIGIVVIISIVLVSQHIFELV